MEYYHIKCDTDSGVFTFEGDYESMQEFRNAATEAGKKAGVIDASESVLSYDNEITVWRDTNKTKQD